MAARDKSQFGMFYGDVARASIWKVETTAPWALKNMLAGGIVAWTLKVSALVRKKNIQTQKKQVTKPQAKTKNRPLLKSKSGFEDPQLEIAGLGWGHRDQSGETSTQHF